MAACSKFSIAISGNAVCVHACTCMCGCFSFPVCMCVCWKKGLVIVMVPEGFSVFAFLKVAPLKEAHENLRGLLIAAPPGASAHLILIICAA